MSVSLDGFIVGPMQDRTTASAIAASACTSGDDGLAGFGFFGPSMSFQPLGRSNENDVNTKDI